MEVSKSSNSEPSLVAGAGVDRLSALLEHFRVRATLFHTGALCGTHRFEARPGRGFLHVLRRGQMQARHCADMAVGESFCLAEPTLLFYPRAVCHEFVNPPEEGADFTCAALEFDGGEFHPIVQSLPAVIVLPLKHVEGLEPSLDLLFGEVDRARCGSRLLADRLFDVVLIQLLRWIIDHPAQAGVSHGVIMGLSDPRLARALVALHQAPHENWPLERMAAVAGMSRSAFAATFRQATGTTPVAYAVDWRLSLAASMMRAGRQMKQAAAQLGFASASSFSKVFRQRMGVSPREWLGEQGRAGPVCAVQGDHEQDPVN
jgi:AraC-like DNA-binding protein